MAASHWGHRCLGNGSVLELVRGRRKPARPRRLYSLCPGHCFPPATSLAPALFTPEMADSINRVSLLPVRDPVAIDVAQDSRIYWRCGPDSGMALVWE